MATKLPTLLYVRSMKDAAGKTFLLAAYDIKALGIAIGETEKIGVFQLTSNLEVKALLETTEVAAD